MVVSHDQPLAESRESTAFLGSRSMRAFRAFSLRIVKPGGTCGTCVDASCGVRLTVQAAGLVAVDTTSTAAADGGPDPAPPGSPIHAMHGRNVIMISIGRCRCS